MPRLSRFRAVTCRLGLLQSRRVLHQGGAKPNPRKELHRYLAGGAAALMDKSSRPALSPKAIDPSVAMTIIELRRKLFLQARIAAYTGVSKEASLSRVLKRAGMSKLTDLSVTADVGVSHFLALCRRPSGARQGTCRLVHAAIG